MLKAYKYSLTKEQEEMFFQHFGSCRFIYNWTLAHKINSYEQDGKYYLNILVDDEKEIPAKSLFNKKVAFGTYVEIIDFAVIFNGEKIESPKYLENSMQRLNVLQRRMSKKQKGSKNRAKTKFAVLKLHEKIRNQRNDFQHKLSSKLIVDNQALAFETLNVSGILKYHYLAQYIADAS